MDGRDLPPVEPLDGWLVEPISRRALLVRAAALGVSAAGLGAILDACARLSQPSVTPPVRGDLPVVLPTPRSVTYGSMLQLTELVTVSAPTGSFRGLLEEVAADTGLPLGAAASPGVGGRRQARLTVTADDQSFGSQAYRLEIADTTDGPVVSIRAGDEAGAYYGLLSLGQLVSGGPAGGAAGGSVAASAASSAAGSILWVRAATIDDAPGFTRRGAILDPAPQTGVTTPASRAELMDRVRTGVRYKFNFLDLPGRTPWPELVRYCRDHHVELMVAWGYSNKLTTADRGEVKRQLAAQQDAGARSISLAWDDMAVTNPEAQAKTHSEVFLDLYGNLRSRDPSVRVSVVLPPYGGIPGRNLMWSRDGSGNGERYLAAMRDVLPKDVRVFWTGDGGVFSSRVTAAGARAYADAIGHEIALWDNDTIRFSRGRHPLSGRDPDVSSVVPTYMGNLGGESNWKGTNGEFALLTSLFYAWNPSAYDPSAAGAAVERILESREPLSTGT